MLKLHLLTDTARSDPPVMNIKLLNAFPISSKTLASFGKGTGNAKAPTRA